MERSLWRAGQKLNQPISNPAHFLTSVSSQFVCMEAVKFSGFLMAKPVTFDTVFQSREQDGDPSKHAWAKPGSVNSPSWKDSRVKSLNLILFKGDDFAVSHSGNTPFGIDSMPELRKKRPIPLVSELVSKWPTVWPHDILKISPSPTLIYLLN